MGTANTTTDTDPELLREPRTIFWHGIRLYRQLPHSGDTDRWESHLGGSFPSCWLAKSKIGQYAAAFTYGLACYGYDVDKTLYEACVKAYDFKLYDAERLRELLLQP